MVTVRLKCSLKCCLLGNTHTHTHTRIIPLSFAVYLFDFWVSSSCSASVEGNVRQVLACRSQTDPTRYVAHTKELSQRVREDDQPVPERILIPSPTARCYSFFLMNTTTNVVALGIIYIIRSYAYNHTIISYYNQKTKKKK